MAESLNVAKFNAGGSGDNKVPQGFIKTIVQSWFDRYTINFTNTNTTIDIAILPQKRKVMGIEVLLFTTASQTNGTISIGFSTDAAVDTFMAPTTITNDRTFSSIVLPTIGFNMFATSCIASSFSTLVTPVPIRQAAVQRETTGTQTTISVKLNNWTMTTGTMYTVVRYT